MQFAINEKGKRTYIMEANGDGQYRCPYCDAPMIQRRGSVNIPHFAHAKGCLCADGWKYEEMSEWHLSWQGNFSLDSREVVVTNGFGRHRADVLVNNTVVEFQHSPMSPEEFWERNGFYTACGYRVIWVFDARAPYGSGLLFKEGSGDSYRWKHAPKTISGFNAFGEVQVYFHLQDKRTGEGDTLIRLTWCHDGNLSYFRSSPYACYTEEDFVRLVTTGTAARSFDDARKMELHHDLFVVRRKDTEMDEVCGCPLNDDGFASDTPSGDGRQCCNECPYAKGMDDYGFGVRKCAGRFRDCLEQIETIIGEDERENQICSVAYIDKEGMIRERSVDVPMSPASTIPDLWNEYNAGVMCVRNVRSGKVFMVNRNPGEMLLKYRKVYGYYFNDSFGRYSNKSDVIYYAVKPEWVVSWFKTEEQKRRYGS